MFKLYHGDLIMTVNDIICSPCYVGRKDHKTNARRLQSRILPYHDSYLTEAVRDWNALSTGMIEVKSVNEFKNMTTD